MSKPQKKYSPGYPSILGSDFVGNVVAVDPGAMTVSIDGEVTNIDVCNVIPAMKTGRIADWRV